MSDIAPGLIADIGGTNARFALVDPGGAPRDVVVLRCSDYVGPEVAARAYIEHVAPSRLPLRAAFAVASPVTGDAVDLTNHVWSFSVEETRRALGLDRLDVVNDFLGVALGLPHLGEDGRVSVGGGRAVPGMPVAVLGPGTGLGVSALVPARSAYMPVATEGGHVTMPACDDREAAILALLRRRMGHVSAERVLSGPGLVNLHIALSTLAGAEDDEVLTPEAITARALSGACPLCAETLATFFAMLGTVAGNLALSYGARGGVYVAGGIVPQLLPAFTMSAFRTRFEDKGRFRDYLAAIPTFVVTDPYPAFTGLAALVGEEGPPLR